MKKSRILLFFGVLVLGIGVFFVALKNSATTDNIQCNIPNMEFYSIAIEDVDDTGYLVLVNQEYPLMVDFNDSEFVQVLASVPTAPIGIQDMYLHSSALMAVEEMFNSAREAGIGALSVTSGFREYDEQQELYDDGVNSEYVLPPGHSEHNTGLAVDITAVGVSGSNLGNSQQGRWLSDNSYRFGLILRYPEGAEVITGINYEPWHFRYVGSIHADYMKQNNLVLEEYIQLIQEQGSLCFEKDSITYYISYQVPQNSMIYLPEGLDFLISNDNTGGYIVTAW